MTCSICNLAMIELPLDYFACWDCDMMDRWPGMEGTDVAG